jgi:hypothetical protein
MRPEQVTRFCAVYYGIGPLAPFSEGTTLLKSVRANHKNTISQQIAVPSMYILAVKDGCAVGHTAASPTQRCWTSYGNPNTLHRPLRSSHLGFLDRF